MLCPRQKTQKPDRAGTSNSNKFKSLPIAKAEFRESKYILSDNSSYSIAQIGLQFLRLSLIEVQEWSWLG
jgi:hypothetical protein